MARPTAFVKVPEALLRWQPAEKSKRISLTDKVVWAGIADRVRVIGPAVGVRLLAKFLGCDTRTITRAIERLEAAGILRVDRADKVAVRGSRQLPAGTSRAARRNRYNVVDPTTFNVGNSPTLDAAEGQSSHVNVDNSPTFEGQSSHLESTGL